VGGRLAGVLMFEREKLNRMHHVGMMGMAVLKAYHRQGLGTALLNACLSWARAQPGLEKVRLEVFNTNPVAVRLYEKFGFVHEGARKREIRIRGQYADLMLMAKFLS
jgi:RimJ/RimL family protein N-acetyltransferase